MIRRLVIVAAVALVAAPSAAAHAIPIETSPAPGARLVTSPAAVSVTFDGVVRAGPRNAAVDSSGDSVLAGGARVLAGRTLIVPLRARLPRGDYTVRWSAVSDDGHEEEGLIAFGVGIGGPQPAPTLTVHGFVTWQRVVMRSLFFLGALGAIGVVAFVLGVLRPLRLEQRLLRRETNLLFACLLLAFCGGDALTHTAGAAGTRFERWITVATVAAAVGCMAAALAPLYSRLRYLSWGAAGIVFACPTLAGHALDADQPALIAPAADLLHLGGAAVWVGGVAALVAFTGGVSGADRPSVATRFSSLAIPAVGVIAVAGASRAVTELSSVGQIWSTGYGRALLVKSILFAVALTVGWLNRSSLVTGLARATRSLSVELALLAGIVVAAGALTDLQPGRVAAAPRAAATPPVRFLFGRGRLAGDLPVACAIGREVTLDDLEEAWCVLEGGKPGDRVAQAP